MHDVTPVERRPRERDVYVAGAAEAVSATAFTAIAVFYLGSSADLEPTQVATLLSAAGVLGFLAPLAVGPWTDRAGPHVTAPALTLVQALAFGLLALPWVGPFSGLILGVLYAAMRSSGIARVALIGSTFDKSQHTTAQLRLRSSMFLGAALGSGLSGICLVVGTEGALRFTLLLCSALCILSALSVRKLSRAQSRFVPRRVRMRTVLRDRPFVTLSVTTAAIGVHDAVITVAIPLVAVKSQGIPAWIAAACLAIQALGVIVFQGRAGRNVCTDADAVRCYLQAALISTGAGVMVVGAGVVSDSLVSFSLLLLAAAAVTISSLRHAAGAAHFRFSLAPQDMLGSYSAVFSLARAGQLMVSPLIVTFLLVHPSIWGIAGWWGLMAAAFTVTWRTISLRQDLDGPR